MTLFFITSSEGKFSEIKGFLPGLERLDLDLPEVQSLDPQVVIAEKLRAAHALRPSDAFIVEDTSLSFVCLNGLPGTFIRWFQKALGLDALASLALRDGNAMALARTMIGYLPVGGEPVFFEGRVEGTIVAPRGSEGFGWDAIFVPEGYDRTFAELGLDVKNSLSMRRKAVEQLKQFMEQ